MTLRELFAAGLNARSFADLFGAVFQRAPLLVRDWFADNRPGTLPFGPPQLRAGGAFTNFLAGVSTFDVERMQACRRLGKVNSTWNPRVHQWHYASSWLSFEAADIQLAWMSGLGTHLLRTMLVAAAGCVGDPSTAGECCWMFIKRMHDQSGGRSLLAWTRGGAGPAIPGPLAASMSLHALRAGTPAQHMSVCMHLPRGAIVVFHGTLLGVTGTAGHYAIHDQGGWVIGSNHPTGGAVSRIHLADPSLGQYDSVTIHVPNWR